MEILSRFGLGQRQIDYLYSPVMSLASPFAEPGNLQQVIISDLFAEDGASALENLPLSREEAMTIPAVNKVRSILLATIPNFPLKAFPTGSTEALPLQPTYLYRDDLGQSPHYRMSMTCDDLLFFGTSLWIVERGSEKQITAAEWLPQKRWQITNGVVHVDDIELADDAFILFEIPGYPGLLNVGTRTLRHARNVEVDIDTKTRNHIPATILSLTETVSATSEELAQLKADWIKARKDPDGAVAVIPQGVEVSFHGEQSQDLLIEARNAIVTNVGQLTGIRASMLDGTASIDSLTYTTKDGERNAFYEFDLPFWTAPIEATLSAQGVPRGQRVRFDKYEAFNLPTPTGIPTED